MKVFKHALEVDKRQTLVDITAQVRDDIRKSGVQDGIVVVYCPHTTAGITINENADLEEGRLILGTWQDIYFCEFDGPRHRSFYVKILEG